jgi:hypothetical protein
MWQHGGFLFFWHGLMHARPRLGRTLITEAKVPLIISTTRVHPVTIIDTGFTYNPITVHFSANVCVPGRQAHPAKIEFHAAPPPHFLAELENSSGIMEQTTSSFIFKCQMAAELCRYLIIANKLVHYEPVYAHFSGVGAYTGSRCMGSERHPLHLTPMLVSW